MALVAGSAAAWMEETTLRSSDVLPMGSRPGKHQHVFDLLLKMIAAPRVFSSTSAPSLATGLDYSVDWHTAWQRTAACGSGAPAK